jgi:ferredoxin
LTIALEIVDRPVGPRKSAAEKLAKVLARTNSISQPAFNPMGRRSWKTPTVKSKLLKGNVHAISGPSTTRRTSAAKMFFDLSKAFANDADTLARSAKDQASNGPKRYEVTFKGPEGQSKKTTAVAGEPLKRVAQQNGVQIKYGCERGSCKTCEVKIAGQTKKLCQGAIMPAKDVTVEHGINVKKGGQNEKLMKQLATEKKQSGWR